VVQEAVIPDIETIEMTESMRKEQDAVAKAYQQNARSEKQARFWNGNAFNNLS